MSLRNLPGKLLFFAVLTAPLPLFAGTVVEYVDLEGNIKKQLISKQKLRLETDQYGYMLVNLEKKQFYSVEPDEKRIIDMSGFYQKNDADVSGQRVVLNFEKIGKGPKVAGYKTIRYKMKIKDYVCADVYLSKEAYELADIQTLFGVFAYKAGKESAMGVSGDGDPCERAEFEMSEQQYKKYGVPMKSVSHEGHTNHEFKTVNTAAKISSKEFNLPKSYKTLEFEELYKLMQ